jgi:hypothetical protein
MRRRLLLPLPVLVGGLWLAGCMPKADQVPLHYGTTVPAQAMVFPAALMPQVNQNFTGSMQFLNRGMALPPGTWRVAATQALANKSVGLVGAIVALVQTQGTSLRSVLIFAGNARPSNTGFPVSLLCRASDVIWNDVRQAVPQGDQDCAVVNFERVALWRAVPRTITAGIMGQLDMLNVQPPNMVVSVSVHEANRNWELDETLLDNPDLQGIAPDMSTQRAQSAWTAFRLSADPAKQRFVEDLKARAAPLRTALRRQIDAPAPYLPHTGLTPA